MVSTFVQTIVNLLLTMWVLDEALRRLNKPKILGRPSGDLGPFPVFFFVLFCFFAYQGLPAWRVAPLRLVEAFFSSNPIVSIIR